MSAVTKAKKSIDAAVVVGTSTSMSCRGRIAGLSSLLASTLSSVTDHVTTRAAVTSEISSRYHSLEALRRPVQPSVRVLGEITGHAVSRSHRHFPWCICQHPRAALSSWKSRRSPTWSWTIAIVRYNAWLYAKWLTWLEATFSILWSVTFLLRTIEKKKKFLICQNQTAWTRTEKSIESIFVCCYWIWHSLLDSCNIEYNRLLI